MFFAIFSFTAFSPLSLIFPSVSVFTSGCPLVPFLYISHLPPTFLFYPRTISLPSCSFPFPLPEYSVVALSATSGSMLWRRPLREPVKSVQCGLQTGAASSAVTATHSPLQTGPVCLLVGSSHLTAVNGSSGRFP